MSHLFSSSRDLLFLDRHANYRAANHLRDHRASCYAASLNDPHANYCRANYQGCCCASCYREIEDHPRCYSVQDREHRSRPRRLARH
jgi:hypothetical protein